MRLSLKTKFTLATSLLVLAVVTVVSGLYIARLTRQTLRQADDRARFVADQIFLACQNALTDAAERGDAPASNSPADLRDYVQRALDNSSTLNSVMESAIGYSPTIYEITISDRDGIVLVSSDASSARPKNRAAPAASTPSCAAASFEQLRTLYGPPQIYEDSLPFNARVRTLRRHPHRPLVGAHSQRNFARAGVRGLLRAGCRLALHSAGASSSAALRSRPSSASPRNWTASPPANSTSSRWSAATNSARSAPKSSASENNCATCAKFSAPCAKISIR